MHWTLLLLAVVFFALSPGAPAAETSSPAPAADPLGEARRAVEVARLRLRLFDRVDYPLRLQQLDGRCS